MQKLIFAFWDEPARQERLNQALLGPVRERLESEGVYRLRVNVPDDAVAKGQSLYPEMAGDRPAALISFFVNTARDIKGPLAAVASAGAARAFGYETVESTPLPVHTVADGKRPVGFTQVAFFRRLPGQSQEDFLRIWLDSHTAVAIETQSTFFYQQNPVLRSLDPAAPQFDAIVEESFPDAAMEDWEVYFNAVGAPDKLQAHRARMSESCARFIDFTTIKLLITSEYRFGGWQDLP